MTSPRRAALIHHHGPARPSRPRPASPPPAPGKRKRLLRIAGLLTVIGVAIGCFLGGGIWLLLEGSLPLLDGAVRVAGISAPVRIERDELGIPTIHGESRADVAFATGFVHAQDRFFQMDLLRRRTAGELAELIGPELVEEDKKMRLHRFRFRAGLALADLPQADRDLLRAYTRGVEAGRKALSRPPWEYLLLGVDPVGWREEDTLLVALGMYQILQEGPIERERNQALIDDLVPPALAAFLSPAGSLWDSPMQGGQFPSAPVPAMQVIDLRTSSTDWFPPGWPDPERFSPGSNNWAVSGARTVHGGAIVANDMHLGLFVPNLWYRAAFVWPDKDGRQHRVYGVTLPGAPPMIVGSNTHVAWGFTNTEGDYADLVLLEPEPGLPGHYRTPEGPRPIVIEHETIRVNGGDDVRMRLEETIWGPVLDRDHRGRRRVVRWVAHDPGAVNLELLRLETARTLKEALDLAPRVGAPAQNLVAADSRGNIGWTVLGRIPHRIGFDGRKPTSWADGKHHWDGWLSATDYPRIVNPPDGRLWSANNRVVGEPYVSRLGLGTYDLGARAGQIRDSLSGDKKFAESDMLAIQLDDRALFLTRWQRLLLQLLNPEVTADHPHRQAIHRQVVGWGGRATPDSVGYRIVKRFRNHVHSIILRSLTAPCLRIDPALRVDHLDPSVEDSVWQLVTQRPPHLLPLNYKSWDDLLLDALDRVEREIRGKRPAFMPALRGYTQGASTKTRIRHPFSSAVGPLRSWLRLDMPDEELPGDSRAMPRIQSARDGASQRMAVSPGREAEGYFHMPTGQCGHPLSPHYRDAHDDWARGRPTPFLPGPARHVLELRPR